MTPIIALLLGTVGSLALVGLARTYPPRRERRIYAFGLVVAALIYVGLGATGGTGARWLALEILGVLLYGVAAWGGLRGRPWLLAAGWAAHVAWDVPFHLSGAGAEYTPRWYPWLCLSFDLVVAGAVLASSRRGTARVDAVRQATAGPHRHRRRERLQVKIAAGTGRHFQVGVRQAKEVDIGSGDVRG